MFDITPPVFMSEKFLAGFPPESHAFFKTVFETASFRQFQRSRYRQERDFFDLKQAAVRAAARIGATNGTSITDVSLSSVFVCSKRCCNFPTPFVTIPVRRTRAPPTSFLLHVLPNSFLPRARAVGAVAALNELDRVLPFTSKRPGDSISSQSFWGGTVNGE